jgi:hypothetical protein
LLLVWVWWLLAALLVWVWWLLAAPRLLRTFHRQLCHGS